MPPRLAALLQELAEADSRDRMEILIDLGQRLTPPPADFAEEDHERHRVEECQSPVYLFVGIRGRAISLTADVPHEAPTVRGFLGLLAEGLEGATADDVLALPDDLLDRAGIGHLVGMMRRRGLEGILRRLKQEVARAAHGSEQHPGD